MREMKKIFAGILMTVLLTGCSSQEILSEVPQTIVLPEEQIDSLPMQEEDPTSAETENTESFSLLEEGGSRFAYESLEAPEHICGKPQIKRKGVSLCLPERHPF